MPQLIRSKSNMSQSNVFSTMLNAVTANNDGDKHQAEESTSNQQTDEGKLTFQILTSAAEGDTAALLIFLVFEP